MRPKRKLWLSVTSLCLVVILGVTSVAVVLASLSANVNNDFSITYTPRNVKATLAGSYTLGSSTNIMSSNGVQGIINFNGTETAGTKSFDNLGLIEIDENNSFQINYFLANYDEESLPVNATLSSTPQNLRVTYTTSLFDGTQTTERSETMAVNTPTSTIEVPYSNFDNVDTLKANPEIDQVNAIFTGCMEGDLISPLSNLTPIKNSSALGDYVSMSLEYIAINVYCEVLVTGRSTLCQSFFNTSPSPNQQDTLSNFKKLLEQYIPSNISLDWLSTRAFQEMTNFASENYHTPLTADQQTNLYDIYQATLSDLMSGACDYSSILGRLRDVALKFFNNNFMNLFSLIPDPIYTLPSLTDTTLPTEWQEKCLLLGAPCLLITIKFEIIDTKQPASFNGGINLDLG